MPSAIGAESGAASPDRGSLATLALVSWAGSVWSLGARALRRVRPNRAAVDRWADDQANWIAEHAQGNTFADIGGLFMKEGADAFAAEDAGATVVTCFDAGDPDLCGFAEEHRRRDSSVRFVQGDLEELESVVRIGRHDIVWCTGVLYHSPNPLRQLMHLRSITGRLLYLGTLTIPEVPGFPNACVFYPYLGERDRAPYAAGYRWAPGVAEGMLAVGRPVDEAPMQGYGNCWWGMSRSALKAMLRTARFEVVEERPHSQAPFVTELVARPVDADPLMPPESYYRERGEARERDGTRLPFEDYYEHHPAYLPPHTE